MPQHDHACPECGADPRMERIAPPGWAHLRGAPLVLAVLAALCFGYGGVQEHRTLRTGISRSACEPWVRPTVRVSDVRAGAAGDAARASEVLRAALQVAALDPGALSTSALAVALFEGEGWHARQVRLGWPLRWLTIGDRGQ